MQEILYMDAYNTLFSENVVLKCTPFVRQFNRYPIRNSNETSYIL